MDLKCRTLLKKTAWPGEGMQLLKNMGFKTAAMALRDDSVGIDNQTLQAEEKLAIVLGTEGDRAFLTDDCRLRLYSENSHVSRCGFLKCGCRKCSGILGTWVY